MMGDNQRSRHISGRPRRRRFLQKAAIEAFEGGEELDAITILERMRANHGGQNGRMWCDATANSLSNILREITAAGLLIRDENRKRKGHYRRPLELTQDRIDSWFLDRGYTH